MYQLWRKIRTIMSPVLFVIRQLKATDSLLEIKGFLNGIFTLVDAIHIRIIIVVISLILSYWIKKPIKLRNHLNKGDEYYEIKR